jgi:hypothetical protein
VEVEGHLGGDRSIGKCGAFEPEVHGHSQGARVVDTRGPVWYQTKVWLGSRSMSCVAPFVSSRALWP